MEVSEVMGVPPNHPTCLGDFSIDTHGDLRIHHLKNYPYILTQSHVREFRRLRVAEICRFGNAISHTYTPKQACQCWCFFIHIYLICLSAPVCLSACPPACLPACLLVCLFACLPVCLFANLPACLAACLPIYLSYLISSHLILSNYLIKSNRYNI